MTQPTCAVLLIGDELLSGRTEDCNMNHIARRMSAEGIHMKEVRVVPDDEQEIVDALNALRAKYTYVFTTGGIGPTHDDITVKSVSKAFQVSIERDANIAAAFAEHFGDDLQPATLKMADFPKGAALISNPVSIAPGFFIENVYCMAGVPHIMRVMLEAVVPSLAKGDVMLSKSIDVSAGEGVISADFEALQGMHPTVELGSYPFRGDDGKSSTSLVIRTIDPNKLEAVYAELIKMLNGLEVDYN